MSQLKATVPTQMLITLPDWVEPELVNWPAVLRTPQEQMLLAVRLSLLNIQHNTGGPFGAIVVEQATGKLVAVGVNRVVPLYSSPLHAEVMALLLAQQAIGNFTLGAQGQPKHSLVTSSQPCAMCFGATVWAGVTEVVIGATRGDVESLTGFNEGPIHPEWRKQFEKHGIAVREGVLQEAACQALRQYQELGGILYNGAVPMTEQ